MIRMMVPAPQWIQQTPQGVAFAQPAGGAVFTNPLEPHARQEGVVGGWHGMMGGLSGFVRVYPDIIFENLYPKFVNETQEAYLARAKRRFQEDYGPVVVQPDEPELHAYARVLWEAKKAARVAQEHRDKYANDPAYRAAVDEEHQRRMAEDPNYRTWVESMAISAGASVSDPSIIAAASTPIDSLAQPLHQTFTAINQGADPRYRVLAIPPKAASFTETYGQPQGTMTLPTPQPTPWYNSALVGYGALAAIGLGAWWWMSKKKESK